MFNYFRSKSNLVQFSILFTYAQALNHVSVLQAWGEGSKKGDGDDRSVVSTTIEAGPDDPEIVPAADTPTQWQAVQPNRTAMQSALVQHFPQSNPHYAAAGQYGMALKGEDPDAAHKAYRKLIKEMYPEAGSDSKKNHPCVVAARNYKKADERPVRAQAYLAMATQQHKQLEDHVPPLSGKWTKLIPLSKSFVEKAEEYLEKVKAAEEAEEKDKKEAEDAVTQARATMNAAHFELAKAWAGKEKPTTEVGSGGTSLGSLSSDAVSTALAALGGGGSSGAPSDAGSSASSRVSHNSQLKPPSFVSQSSGTASAIQGGSAGSLHSNGGATSAANSVAAQAEPIASGGSTTASHAPPSPVPESTSSTSSSHNHTTSPSIGGPGAPATGLGGSLGSQSGNPPLPPLCPPPAGSLTPSATVTSLVGNLGQIFTSMRPTDWAKCASEVEDALKSTHAKGQYGHTVEFKEGSCTLKMIEGGSTAETPLEKRAKDFKLLGLIAVEAEIAKAPVESIRKEQRDKLNRLLDALWSERGDKKWRTDFTYPSSARVKQLNEIRNTLCPPQKGSACLSQVLPITAYLGAYSAPKEPGNMPPEDPTVLAESCLFISKAACGQWNVPGNGTLRWVTAPRGQFKGINSKTDAQKQIAAAKENIRTAH